MLPDRDQCDIGENTSVVECGCGSLQGMYTPIKTQGKPQC